MHGQQTFNKNYALGTNSLAFGLIETEEGYLVTCDVVDSIHTNFIIKLNKQGEIESLNEYSNSLSIEGHYYRTFRRHRDDLILDVSFSINEENKYENHLMWFSLDGELVEFTSEQSPYYYDDPTSVWDIPDAYRTFGLTTDDHYNIYTTAYLKHPWVKVSKYDKYGSEIWSRQFSSNFGADQPQIGSISYQDNLIYFGKLELSQNFENHNSIIILDSEDGSLVDSIPISENRPVQDIFIHSNSDIFLPMTYCDNGCYSSILAIDSTGTEKWQLTYGDGTFSVFDACYKIIPQKDGTFVSIGDFNAIATDNIELNGNWNNDVVLFKFNDQGEEIWNRKFRLIQSPEDDHVVADIIQTSDNGFAFCGYTANLDPESVSFELPFQRMWLVKTDPCGCLIPGCDPDCNAYPMAPISEDDYLILGPSPTTGPLNVYLKPLEDPNLELLVHDMTGRVIHSISQAQTDITYMMDLSNQAEGVYLVTLRSEEKVLQMEKVVVTR